MTDRPRAPERINMEYRYLFSPMKIGTMEVKNRVVMNAAEFSLGQTNGCPTEKMMDYYEERAKGEVGLIIPGICRVNDMGATSTFTQLSMANDFNIEPMREMARRIHSHGAKLCIQLHHPGRQGYASAINSLPAVIPLVDRFPKLPGLLFKATPLLLGMEAKRVCFSVQSPSGGELSAHGATRIHAMSNKAVKKLIADFVDAAERCKKADVDAVELHATHGYIIQQFLSPNTNRRTDEYGGSFENRLRFLSEIVIGIKHRCGSDYPLIVRLCADEMYDRVGKPGKGYDLETGKRIAKRLEELGVDAIDVSSACYDAYNYWLEPTSFTPGWRAYLAKAIKETVSIPVIAANFIRSPEQAERQIADGTQDFAGSARNFICDPHWALKAKEGRENEIRRCIGCLHCIESFMTNAMIGKPGECALNPGVGREKEYEHPINIGQRRPVVVVGAGPAGLTAAVTLRRRGFAVTVLEQNEKAGGQVIAASAGHLKEKLYWAIEDLLTQAKKLGVEIKYGVKADEATLRAMTPYAVFLATGAAPVVPRAIPGIGGENVVTAESVLLGQRTVENRKVVVIGSGLTGLEVAEVLTLHGNTVTVVEMADKIAPKAWFQHVDDAMSRLGPAGVEILTSTRLVSVGENAVRVAEKDGHSWEIPAETVVLAMGVRPNRALLDEVQNLNVPVYVVGDAGNGGSIGRANRDAYQKAAALE